MIAVILHPKKLEWCITFCDLSLQQRTSLIVILAVSYWSHSVKFYRADDSDMITASNRTIPSDTKNF
jgi:hypothetical protein